MGFDDPFYGYSFAVRTIVYVIVPLFTSWQFVRLRRALHVFQLEGYKRARFLDWCRTHRAMFLKPATAKKPLVMTGRAWRILVTATLLSAALVLLPAAATHLAAGAPYDLVAWGLTTVLAFFAVPGLLVTADAVLQPVQGAINSRYKEAARRRLSDISPTVVGVTGSFGKTSTKFAIRDIAGQPGRAFATPGSYNTPMGITRAINEGLQPTHDLIVVEMGAYQRGEIAELCAFVRPTIGVLTAIGPAHLERFGSIETIRAAKYEIVESLPADGIAVMNMDDGEVRALADRGERRTLRYGMDPSGRPDVTAEEIETTRSGSTFSLIVGERRASVSTRLLGRFAIGHILAGVAVGQALGRSFEDLAAAIASLEPVKHRLQLISGRGGVTVIDDAFNSNPQGAAAALEVLDAMPASKRVVVTPGIIELGPLQVEANERFGEAASEVADVVIVVSKVNRDALTTGAKKGPADVIVVDTLAEATEKLQGLLDAGAVVLFENDLPDHYEV